MSATMLAATEPIPHLFWVWPFVAILLAIAILPLLRTTHHWWEHNRNKLIVSLALAAVTLLYYGLRGYGVVRHEEPGEAAAATQPAEGYPAEPEAHAAAGEEAPAGAAPTTSHRTEPGLKTVLAVLDHAVLQEYVPFLTLLFALYVISGGIVVRGDIQARPLVNTTILGIGGIMASFIGTTGASMVLIRLLLKTNAERRRIVHTVVFFIFIVSNVGGTLLPIGDPPLFLGYLRGVPFFWTFSLWKEWGFMLIVLLAVYYLWDTWAYRHEPPSAIRADIEHIEPLRVAGMLNFLWLLGVVGAVITLVPGKEFLNTGWIVPPHVRELVQLALSGVALLTTPARLRQENQFNYTAIGEVACLFIGIFITMQIPIEILHAKGPELGLTRPWHFYWATGMLSSFLDNAPTYVVFFETANTLTHHAGPGILLLADGRFIREDLLAALSCGAVFMGANTYIGNGPNFMVKSIAEQAGVPMPSFFGYMIYSLLILVPLFVVLTLIFFRA